MKKKLSNIVKFLMLLVLASSCQEDDKSFGTIDPPTDLQVTAEIVGAKSPDSLTGDGSGLVNIVATAKGAMTYKFVFSDGSESNAIPSGKYTHRFTKPGVNTYVITAIAYGSGGAPTSKSISVTVYSSFTDPETVQFLTGGTTKTWYWYASKQDHLGVGPNDTSPSGTVPQYYGAAPFEKEGGSSSCLYLEKLVFRLDGEDLKFKLETNGNVFFNESFNSVGGSSASGDQCLAYDTSEEKLVSLSPATSVVPADKTTGTALNFNGGGFMGYYVGSTTYEIMKITDTEMYVRTVMGGNPALAWYHIFTTKTIEEQRGGGGTEPDFTTLKWSDEFDYTGAPDASKWVMETGTGQSGWGNNEEQYYRAENANVSGGTLKITAKSEVFGGKQYTSARMKTEGLYDFTYGKVEIKAKLPTGSGTWPALWALGANYQTNVWPKCGEIDIMEHKGNEQNKVHGTLHMEGGSGSNGPSGNTTVPGLSDDFHIYTLHWSATKIIWSIDNVPFYTYNNNSGTPFNADFFLIMNVAMGGNFGGAIAPGFTSSSMEVDYIRVYQ